MRTKIRVGKAWFKPVTWLKSFECEGCIFDTVGCINSDPTDTKFNTLCDDGQEFSGMIFIPNTKEAIATYVITRLEGDTENEDDT
jgi:hypothetical protein